MYALKGGTKIREAWKSGNKESVQMTATNFISMEARLPDCKQSNIPAGTPQHFISRCWLQNKETFSALRRLMFGEIKVQKQLVCSQDVFELIFMPVY